MKIILHELTREEFVFGYIESGNEITLIMDEDCQKLFEGFGEVIFEGKRRKAFQFSFKCSPCDDTGMISSITRPFTASSIDIFYFMTVNSDFVFVEERNFERSKAILKKEFANIWLDEENLSPISPSTSLHLPIADQGTETQTLPIFQPKTSVNWKLLQSFPKLKIIQSLMNLNSHDGIQTQLLQLIFFSNTTNRFLSLALIEQEISLTWDNETFRTFDHHYLQTTLYEVWIPIKRSAKEGFQEVGVVSALVEPLKKQSLLYLSAYDTSFMFVLEKQYQQALKQLEGFDFRVIEQS
jgi:hypothetical protein